jgi:hypothetical protein
VRKATLRPAGGSIGATLPKEMADRLHSDRVAKSSIETDQGADGGVDRKLLVEWVGRFVIPLGG